MSKEINQNLITATVKMVTYVEWSYKKHRFHYYFIIKNLTNLHFNSFGIN